MSGSEGYHHNEIRRPEPQNAEFAALLADHKARPDKCTAQMRINYAWEYWQHKHEGGPVPVADRDPESSVMGQKPRAAIRAEIDKIIACEAVLDYGKNFRLDTEER